MDNRICIDCRLSKGIEEFHSHIDKRDGRSYFSSYCITCERSRGKAKFIKYKQENNIPDKVVIEEQIIDGVRHVKCSTCQIMKSSDLFYKNKNTKNGLFGRCKSCKQVSDKIDYEKHAESRKKKSAEYYSLNKELFKIKGKEYRSQPSVKKATKESKSKYNIENREDISAKHKKYYEDNKQKINKKYTEKRRTNIQFRLAANLRSRVWHAMKKGNKKLGFTELIGCTTEELQQHITKQFQIGMSWDNYGINTWHIDHILPCDNFDLTKEAEQRKCFHYTNLQPKWAFENLSKNKYAKASYTYDFSEACMI